MEDKLDPSVKSLKTLAVIVVLLSTMAQLCQGVGCHYKCMVCDNNQTCTECSDPYFAYNDTCYKLCSDNSSTATPGYGQTTLPVTTPTGTPPPTTSCLDECPPDYFQKGSSKRTCEPCHNQCNSSCSGPGPEDCTTCKNYIENSRCVEQCGIDTFDNGNKICVSCSTNCSVPECVDSDNCTSTTTVAPEEPESGLPLYIIIPAAAGGAVVIIVIIIIIIYCCRRRSSEDRDPEISDVNKSPVDDAAGDSNDGQHNPGCDWTDAEPATTDDVYGNVDNMGNLINIPAEQTTAEALARLSHHSAENGGAHSPSGAWGAATNEEYVNPDFNQTDDEYVNPDFQQEDYVAPDMTQQQWGQEYTALDQSTVPPELSSSVSYDKQIPVSTPENIPTTDPIYQNINAVQSATPPPPISPRHASLAGPSKTSNTKAKKPAFDSFNENELLSVPAPFPQIGSPKKDVSIELEEFKRKHQKIGRRPEYDRSNSIPSLEPPTPPIRDDDDLPPPPVQKPDDFGEQPDSLPFYDPPPPPVAKPTNLTNLTEPDSSAKKGKLVLPSIFSKQQDSENNNKPAPPGKPKQTAKPPGAKGNVKGHAKKLEGFIPTGPPPKVSPTKTQAPVSKPYVDMKPGKAGAAQKKPPAFRKGRANLPKLNAAEISAARNKLISQGIYDENEAIDLDQIYEAMENGQLDDIYEAMDGEPVPDLSQRPLPPQPSEGDVYAVGDSRGDVYDDAETGVGGNMARGQQKRAQPTTAIVPRKDQMNARKAKAKPKLPDPVEQAAPTSAIVPRKDQINARNAKSKPKAPEPVQDEEYEVIGDNSQRNPAVPPRWQPKNVKPPAALADLEYEVTASEPAPSVLPRKPLKPKMEKAIAEPVQETYEVVTIGAQQDDTYEPVEVSDGKMNFKPYHNLPNIGPKPRDSDMVYRNLPGSRAQHGHPEGGYVSMQYKK